MKSFLCLKLSTDFRQEVCSAKLKQEIATNYSWESVSQDFWSPVFLYRMSTTYSNTEAKSKEKHSVCGPIPELTITSSFVHSRRLQKQSYHGQPYATVEFYPMPESTFSPSQGLSLAWKGEELQPSPWATNWDRCTAAAADITSPSAHLFFHTSLHCFVTQWGCSGSCTVVFRVDHVADVSWHFPEETGPYEMTLSTESGLRMISWSIRMRVCWTPGLGGPAWGWSSGRRWGCRTAAGGSVDRKVADDVHQWCRQLGQGPVKFCDEPHDTVCGDSGVDILEPCLRRVSLVL
jgi:hypothetical protein